MAIVTHQQTLEIAMEHHRSGRLAEAETIYRQFLAIYPQNADLWNYLGVRPSDRAIGGWTSTAPALDPFLYNGMTTTCDALWMGVPVVALVGAMPTGGAAFSLLTNAGLPGLAAHSEEEYARIAVGLATDLPRLGALHATLRDRMKASPLLDAPRFARNLEAAFRTIWARWCAAPLSASSRPEP